MRGGAFLEESGLVGEYDGLDTVAQAELGEDVRDVCLAGLGGPSRSCLGRHTAVSTSPPASWPFPPGNCRAAAPPAGSEARRTTNTHGAFS